MKATRKVMLASRWLFSEMHSKSSDSFVGTAHGEPFGVLQSITFSTPMRKVADDL